MDLRVLILPAKRDAEPVGRNTLDFEVEIAPESPYMAQGRTIPSGRQRRSHLKRSESRRTNAEQSFGKNTAVEAALGRKLPHRTGAFGPCLDKIGDMIARKAPSCKPMQKIARLIGAACPENTPQGIERRAIPENRIALFRQQAVLRMEFGAEQRGNRPLTTSERPTTRGMQIQARSLSLISE